MGDLRKAAKMALEVMEYNSAKGTPNMGAAMEALRQALAQPEQEPAMWVTPDGNGYRLRLNPPINDVPLGWEPLYTAPPKREWVDLDEEEQKECWDEGGSQWAIYQNIASKLKEKNT